MTASRITGPESSSGAALAALVSVFFPPIRGTDVAPYQEGRVAQEDVIAAIPFSIPKAPAELEAERRTVMDAVPPTFDLLPESADTMSARLMRFFDQIDSAAESRDSSRLEAVLRGGRIVATASQMAFLIDDEARLDLRMTGLWTLHALRISRRPGLRSESPSKKNAVFWLRILRLHGSSWTKRHACCQARPRRSRRAFSA